MASSPSTEPMLSTDAATAHVNSSVVHTAPIASRGDSHDSAPAESTLQLRSAQPSSPPVSPNDRIQLPSLGFGVGTGPADGPVVVASGTQAGQPTRGGGPPPAATAELAATAGNWDAKMKRAVAFRILLRICVLSVIITILRVYPRQIKSAGQAYLDWILGLGHVAGPVTFLVVATVFTAVSPTGYLPSIAAGVTFDFAASIPISYLCTVIGAAVNAVAVRSCLAKSPALHRRFGRSALRYVSGLEVALAKHPFRIVTLLRLPFLGNGAINYILSLSDVPFWPMMAGNVVGMLPGSVLFAVMGRQVRSLATIIADGTSDPATIGVFVGVVVVLVVSLATVVLVSRRVARKEKEKTAQAAEAQRIAQTDGSKGDVEAGAPASVTAAADAVS